MQLVKNNPVFQSLTQNNNSQIKEIEKDLTKNNNSNLAFLNNNVVMAQKTFVVKKTIKNIQELTKTGFDGNAIKKNNQDNFFIYSNFLGNPESFYLGVWYKFQLNQ